jgi:hypothetical protein
MYRREAWAASVVKRFHAATRTKAANSVVALLGIVRVPWVVAWHVRVHSCGAHAIGIARRIAVVLGGVVLGRVQTRGGHLAVGVELSRWLAVQSLLGGMAVRAGRSLGRVFVVHVVMWVATHSSSGGRVGACRVVVSSKSSVGAFALLWSSRES